MKRALIICALFCFVVSVSANAQLRDYTGKSWVTGHLGYAFGMGDAFSDYTEPTTNIKFSSDAGIGFGGQFYYGVKQNLLIGGELLFQSYKFEVSAPPDLALGLPGYDISDTQTETNILFNSLYDVNQTRTSDLFLLGGTGFYDFDGMKLGINTGLVWRKQMSESVYLVGMPRWHIVLTDTTPMMIQFTLGAQFNLGG